ncbi:hypothetical protein [Sphingomonas radiodurans]|uniref:hypothetical protein n=1 Tax=Sphingomonas radiodurans TaxID=2890321 RepID=UPI001E4A1AE3|nr:hypothetical protein [Sphingomonas radiodurans]WBH15398.1 hypothetical protein LLW23_11150 [Sphingomonas radiodurans]
MARSIWVMSGVAMLAMGTGAQAAEPDGAGERVLASFAQCRSITDAAQRLDCFDKAASALEQAVKANDVRIVDRGDVRKARRSLFGFTLPKLDLFGRDDDDEKEAPFTEINTTVASAREVANGRVEIRLADDTEAVWQTTEAVMFPPKPGATIRIRKGAIGSYFITFGGKSVRGMRVR